MLCPCCAHTLPVPCPCFAYCRLVVWSGNNSSSTVQPINAGYVQNKARPDTRSVINLLITISNWFCKLPRRSICVTGLPKPPCCSLVRKQSLLLSIQTHSSCDAAIQLRAVCNKGMSFRCPRPLAPSSPCWLFFVRQLPLSADSSTATCMFMSVW